jgi:ABC-2 type transport system ATP-binding protein
VSRQFRLPEALDIPELPAGAERRGRAVTFRTATPTRDLAPLLSWASVRGFELEGLTVSRPTLKDVYLELTEEAASPRSTALCSSAGSAPACG